MNDCPGCADLNAQGGPAIELVAEAISAKVAADLGWPHRATGHARAAIDAAIRLEIHLSPARSRTDEDEEPTEPTADLLARRHPQRLDIEAPTETEDR